MDGIVTVGTLDFLVKSTCEVLCITFNGTTTEEKQAFVNKHFEARNEAVSQILNNEFHEMMTQGVNAR